MRGALLLCSILIAWLGVGCASLSTLEEARALPRGVVRLHVATAAAAGAVTANKTVTKDMWIMNVTFDGSSTGAAVTQLQVDDRVVLGPFSSAEAVDASTFKSNAYQKLDLRGAFVPRGTTLTVNGTIANAADYLKVLFHVKERIRDC